MMELLKLSNSFVHIVAASLSMVVGAIVLVQSKGSSRHKKLGAAYVWLMVINNVTALFIVKAIGKWFFPHYLAIVGLAVILPGYGVTRFKRFRHWLKLHIICMVFSYYLLIGGAINEAFLHIPPLRPLIERNDPIIGMVHLAAMIGCLVMLIYFLWRYRRKRQVTTTS